MSSPVHSLHVAVATPETRPLVWEHRIFLEMHSTCEFSFFLHCPRCRESPPLAFATKILVRLVSPFLLPYLCCDTPLGNNNKRRTGRRGTCLLAFPDQLDGNASGCSIGFPLSEDLLRTQSYMKNQVELPCLFFRKAPQLHVSMLEQCLL